MEFPMESWSRRQGNGRTMMMRIAPNKMQSFVGDFKPQNGFGTDFPNRSLRITINIKSKWACAYISNFFRLQKVHATHGQLLARHEFAFAQRLLAMGCLQAAQRRA